MDEQKIQALGDELYEALCNQTTVPPLTEREPAITIEDAYHISQHMAIVALRPRPALPDDIRDLHLEGLGHVEEVRVVGTDRNAFVAVDAVEELQM